jgi:transposase
MTRFVVDDDRSQSTLFPERLEDYLSEDNPVRAIDVVVDELDLAKLGFGGGEPEATGRPAYHPRTLLKIYVYGYLNRVQSSRRLERECQRNIELVWLTGRLMPDFKTIADFRKDNGEAIRKVCRESTCANRGDWAHEWTSSNLAAVGARMLRQAAFHWWRPVLRNSVRASRLPPEDQTPESTAIARLS